MIGTRLSAYEVLSELGSGGMGTVYLARVAQAAAGLEPGTQVALKVVHPNLMSQPGFFKRFLREAQVGQEVRHENVVRTYDCDATEVGGEVVHFLVMEYVEGQTLRDLLLDLDRVPEQLCRHIGCEVAKGLAAIHAAGVLHRDLKPENVLITEDYVVKVMDLGVARLRDEVIRLSQAGAFVGSLEYAAPERFGSGDAEADARADLYALGVVLYELASGQHPFRGDDASQVMRRILDDEPRPLGELNPQLSAYFEELVGTLIAKDREARFAAADELVGILEQETRSAWWVERERALRARTRQPPRRIHVPRETALYGREVQLATLVGIYEDAGRGHGRVVLVEGEAGIGKTRLVDELVERLRAEGEDINFLFGSYPPGGAATAAGAFSTAYREHFGAAGLEQALGGYLAKTPLLIPAFAALLRGDGTPTGAEPLTKDSMQMAFVHATQRLAAERPTVVLIDDLHLAPEGGRALFASLASALARERVLLIGTARPGIDEAWLTGLERIGHVRRMPLARLGPKDLIHLLTDSFQSARLAAELGAEIALKSDGNPFFTFEIIKGLREGRFIVRGGDGTWSRTQVISEIEIPSSVMDLIQARLAELTEEERDLLEVASCCGFEFDPLLVGETLGLAQIPAMKRFARIEKRYRLVRSRGRRYAFDHHQVQEALYQGMPVLLREPYHAKLAVALEARHAEPTGAVAAELCEHALRARDGPRVVRYLPGAMKHLADGYLHDDAIALGLRALNVEGLLAGRERLEVLLRAALSLELRGRHEEDRAALEEALALAGEIGDDELLARVEIQRGRLALWLGDLDGARERLEAARDLARGAGSDELEATAQGNLGIVHYRRRAFEEAEPLFRLAYDRASERGDARAKAVGILNLGNVAWCRGQFDLAQERYEDYRALSREIGYREGEALAAGNLGNVLLSLGRVDEARSSYEEVLSIAASIGDRRKSALFASSLALAELQLGRLERARELLEQALAVSREIGLRRETAHALADLAEVDDHAGEDEPARARRLAALELFEGLGEREGAADVLLALARRALDGGRAEEAARHLDGALEAARAGGSREQELAALALRACLPGGAPAEAQALLDELRPTLSVPRRMGTAWWLHRATGDPRYLEEAQGMLDRVRASAPPEASDTLCDFWLHRAIQEASATRPREPGGTGA